MSEEERPQEEMSEEQQEGAVVAYEETTPYGIKPREVYYMCLNCGYKISKSELEQYHTMMCPRCGYRIFIKIRAPSTLIAPRRVYAV
jgi:DNA-directed RNA polymerase subunit P